MKKQLLALAALGLLAGAAQAQSSFEGFYGQLATGYESNQASTLSGTGSQNGDNWSTANQNFNGLPLVAGLGYNWSLDSHWMLGLGADYSFLSLKTGTYSSNNQYATTVNGQQLQVSNRTNVYLMPGYALSKDQLVYLKAGYSSANLQETFPSSVTSGGSTKNVNFASSTNTQQGYIVGLGYKQMVTSGLYGFAEANYMSYGKTTFSSTNTNAYTLSNSPTLNTYQALVGVGYKF
jgi:opacity protein-like surface antigen